MGMMKILTDEMYSNGDADASFLEAFGIKMEDDTLTESILVEGKVADIQPKYYSDIDIETVRKLAFADPTAKESKDTTGKFFQWIMNRYKKDNSIIDRLDELTELLNFYRDPANKDRIPEDKRDIGKIKSLDELAEIINSQNLQTNAVHAAASEIDGAEFVCSNAEWEVWHPTTYRSAQLLSGIGRNPNGGSPYAAWCTNGGSDGRLYSEGQYWRSYNRDGKLYIFKNINDPGDTQYQVCIYDNENHTTNLMCDVHDHSVNFKRFILENDVYDMLANNTIASQWADVRALRIAEDLRNGRPLEYTGGTIAAILGDNDLVMAVRNVTIASNVRVIAAKAFAECVNLTSIELPNSVTKIGDLSFSGCTSLEHLVIPNSVTAIGSNAFAKSGLTDIVIPASVESFGKSIFNSCLNLVRVEFEDGIKELTGGTMFTGCTNLEEVHFPASLQAIPVGSNFINVNPNAKIYKLKHRGDKTFTDIKKNDADFFVGSNPKRLIITVLEDGSTINPVLTEVPKNNPARESLDDINGMILDEFYLEDDEKIENNLFPNFDEEENELPLV